MNGTAERTFAETAICDSPEAARAALERVVRSPYFAESERLSRFLRYIVEETLAGRGDRIKEYNIGVGVYERSSGYDPKIDAIVRVEAGRLRTKLAKYYAGEGADDPVRIDLPRGKYIVVLLRAVSTGMWKSDGPADGRRRGRTAAIGVAVVLAIAAVLLTYRQQSREEPALALAVLPFGNAGGDEGTARVAQALAQELTSAIARENAFSVASRTESDHFGSSPHDLAKIGAQLRVNAVLEGSIKRDSDRIRLTVDLVSSRDGYNIWSQSYGSLPDRAEEFNAQVSYLIARTLRARFGGLPESRFSRRQSRDSAAMAQYLKGYEAWLTQRKPGVAESLQFYKQSIEREPRFAKAYEGIAASELFMSSLDDQNGVEHVKRAKIAALKAISLDDRLADPYGRLGNIYLRREWNFGEAERYLQRSVVLEPGYPPTSRWYSEAARLREKYEDARIELENGLLANPASEAIETELGMLDFQLDRLDAAEAHMRRVLAGHPNHRPAHLLAGLLHERAGRLTEAEGELRSCANESEFGRLCLAGLGHVYGAQRKRQEALEIAQQLEASRNLSLAAVTYLGIDDRERALNALEQGYAEREKFLPLVKNDRRFRPLWGEARFRGILHRLGLAAPTK
jgi:TolB-like protein